MSATSIDLVKETKRLSEEVTRPFPRSKKIFVSGSDDSIKVGMREVSCASTSTSEGEELNPAIPI